MTSRALLGLATPIPSMLRDRSSRKPRASLRRWTASRCPSSRSTCHPQPSTQYCALLSSPTCSEHRPAGSHNPIVPRLVNGGRFHTVCQGFDIAAPYNTLAIAASPLTAAATRRCRNRGRSNRDQHSQLWRYPGSRTIPARYPARCTGLAGNVTRMGQVMAAARTLPKPPWRMARRALHRIPRPPADDRSLADVPRN